MKIEDNKVNPLAALLLQLEMLPLRVISFENEHHNFKSVLSGLGEVKEKHKSFNIESMTKEDIEFFKVMSNRNDIAINTLIPASNQVMVATQPEGENQISYKSVNISKGLFNIIEYSFKTQKPVRLDFEGNSSVILKINNEGKLSAEFITGNPAMEYALKTTLPELRQKFDSQGIPYQEISFKDTKQHQNNQNRRNKGENR